jgi:hypothetical protein
MQCGVATVLALGWNRPRRIGGPAPETGFGFLNSSDSHRPKPLVLTHFVHLPICPSLRVSLKIFPKKPAWEAFTVSIVVARSRKNEGTGLEQTSFFAGDVCCRSAEMRRRSRANDERASYERRVQFAATSCGFRWCCNSVRNASCCREAPRRRSSSSGSSMSSDISADF